VGIGVGVDMSVDVTVSADVGVDMGVDENMDVSVDVSAVGRQEDRCRPRLSYEFNPRAGADQLVSPVSATLCQASCNSRGLCFFVIGRVPDVQNLRLDGNLADGSARISIDMTPRLWLCLWPWPCL
jgi:hypothetical protein